MKYLALAVLALSLPAAAQQMYRCGNTFSQQPCGANATVIATPGVSQPAVLPVDNVPADPATVSAAKAACVASIRASLRDPESMKVSDIQRRQIDWLEPLPPFRTPARVYLADVNAKNAFGGYTGEQRWACLFDTQEHSLLRLISPR